MADKNPEVQDAEQQPDVQTQPEEQDGVRMADGTVIHLDTHRDLIGGPIALDADIFRDACSFVGVPADVQQRLFGHLDGVMVEYNRRLLALPD